MKKRTITVEVIEEPFQPGSEYLAGNYPYDGVFQLMDGRFFARYIGMVTQMVFPAGFNPFSAETIAEAEPQVAQVTPGVDNLTFLKALAIAKNPDLALELCQ